VSTVLTNEQRRERKRERDRAYRAANRDKVNAQRRAYYGANRDKELARKRAYYDANRDKLLAQQRSYRVLNRDKMRARNRAYNASKRRREARHPLSALDTSYNGHPWTPAEDSIAMREGLLVIEAACLLRRSPSAVVSRRVRLRDRMDFLMGAPKRSPA
jgi:hypothetical protein